MAIALTSHPRAQPSLASTLDKRRQEVHRECVMSLARNNPRAIAELIARWLREDAYR